MFGGLVDVESEKESYWRFRRLAGSFEIAAFYLV